MTYEFWIAAEKFLYNTLFTRLFILGPMVIILFSMLILMIGRKNKKSRYVFFTILLVFLVLGTSTLIQFNKYKILYDYEAHINYGIRNVKKIVFNWTGPGRDEKKIYEELYLVDNYRNLPFYKEELITQEVDFLGRDGDKFYFQDRDQISYRQLGKNLTIEEGIFTPIREGVRFHLIDSKFEDIGFKKESPSIYLLDYKIPKSMEDKNFQNPEGLKVVEQNKLTLGWITPTPGNKPSKPK